MKQQARRFISCLLIGCFSMVFIPANLLHQHATELDCADGNYALENDPCHVSRFHAHDIQRPHCDHKSHVYAEHNDCEFCIFIASIHPNYIVSGAGDYLSPQPSDGAASMVLDGSPILFSNEVLSRGPPA